MGYFLIHEGVPLDLRDSLEGAGLKPDAALQIGVYSYEIE
jgi:hypothetical protein